MIKEKNTKQNEKIKKRKLIMIFKNGRETTINKRERENTKEKRKKC